MGEAGRESPLRHSSCPVVSRAPRTAAIADTETATVTGAGEEMFAARGFESTKEVVGFVPESAAELACFAQGLPNLRMIARAIFSKAVVDVPRCGDDPVPSARRFVREQTGCESLHFPKVNWALRMSPEGTQLVRMPGWRSTVSFSTQPQP